MVRAFAVADGSQKSPCVASLCRNNRGIHIRYRVLAFRRTCPSHVLRNLERIPWAWQGC